MYLSIVFSRAVTATQPNPERSSDEVDVWNNYYNNIIEAKQFHRFKALPTYSLLVLPE